MERLIKLGFAYADDTEAELMKKQRDEGIESPFREASIEDNLKRFQLMLKGLKEEPKEEIKGDGKQKGDKKGKKEDKKGKEETKGEEKKEQVAEV